MNTKENILKAWITIEQLSEGSIKKKDESLLSIDAKEGNLKKFLGDFLIPRQLCYKHLSLLKVLIL